MGKRYAVIETTSTFRMTYVVEMANNDDDPNIYRKVIDTDVPIELMQEHLGENVIGVRVAKKGEVCRMAREYCYDTWTDDMIVEKLVLPNNEKLKGEENVVQ